MRTHEYFVIKDVAKELRKKYKELYEEDRCPLLSFFSFFESEELRFRIYLKSVFDKSYNGKGDLARKKVVDKLYNSDSAEDFLKRFTIGKPSGIPSLNLTTYVELSSLASKYGLASGHDEYNTFFSKSWEGKLLRSQTFEGSRNIIRNFVEAAGYSFEGEDMTTLKALRYVLLSKKEKKLSFRSRLQNLPAIRKEWTFLKEKVNEIVKDVNDLKLNKKYKDILKKRKRKKFKKIQKRIKKENILTDLYTHFEEECEFLNSGFLQNLTLDEIKKTLKGTNYSGISKEKANKIKSILESFISIRLLNIYVYIAYIWLVKKTMEHLLSFKKRGEIKVGNVSDLKKTGKSTKVKAKQAESTEEDSDTHKCPLCGDDVPNDADSCPGCGEPVIQCPSCGNYVTEDDDECPNCGMEFGGKVFECPECGETVSEDADECPNCGVEFEE